MSATIFQQTFNPRGAEQARSIYVELLHRNGSPQDGDAETLREVLRELGLSADDVKADLGLINQVAMLSTQCARYQEATDARNEGHERLAAAKEEAERVKVEQDAKVAELQHKVYQLTQTAKDLNGYRTERNRLVQEHRDDLFRNFDLI